MLKFEISATRNCKRVTAVCGSRFAVYLMLKVSIKKKYPANTPEINKLSQQAIKGVLITKKNPQKITMHQLKINHNSRGCGMILSLVYILFSFVFGYGNV